VVVVVVVDLDGDGDVEVDATFDGHRRNRSCRPPLQNAPLDVMRAWSRC